MAYYVFSLEAQFGAGITSQVFSTIKKLLIVCIFLKKQHLVLEIKMLLEESKNHTIDKSDMLFVQRLETLRIVKETATVISKHIPSIM